MAVNLRLEKFPWYGQVVAFVVLSVAGVGAFWYWYAAAAQQSISARRAQLATIRVEIDRGIATARRLPEFREEVTNLEAQLDRLRVVLPEERDVAELLRRVEDIATQSNLTIRGFEPRAIANRELHAEWPIGLRLEGSYHDLGAFLERVSKFPRIINVGAIKITAHESHTGGATISAQCTATTFVLLEKPGEAARPATKPAGQAPGNGAAS